MTGSPDLFVVCKNCRAEVSPYITECPYCGHRLRKRAPKLDKGGIPKAPKQRREMPSLGRLRPGEMPGVRVDGRPIVALALVLIPALVTVLAKAGILNALDFVMLAGDEGDAWRPVTSTFYYGSTAYECVALASVFLFAWLLERRHGHWAPLLVYVVGTAAGVALAVATDPTAFATGANGGALALLGAWVVRDLLRLRRGEHTDSDMLGVAAITFVLVLLPAAVQEAHPF